MKVLSPNLYLYRCMSAPAYAIHASANFCLEFLKRFAPLHRPSPNRPSYPILSLSHAHAIAYTCLGHNLAARLL